EFWFEKTRQIIRNHFVTSKVKYFPKNFQKFEKELDGRSMIVAKTDVIPVEFVVRGFLAGSAWKEYKETKSVCGIKIREGMSQFQKLEKPILTPSTKAKKGEHDENITFEQVCELIGKNLAEKIRDICIKLFKFGDITCERNGMYLADTKFEFGINKKDGELMLIDEVLTPDSSRFWLKADYYPGEEQKSYDKQLVRNYLTSIGWNKKPPAPDLPEKLIENTRYYYLKLAEYLKIDMRGLKY
ncbi:MAG: phosphoribosylaminoimidazolesuccinocarboxamide synthase, partial [Thermodesulfobacteriota bacterium]